MVGKLVPTLETLTLAPATVDEGGTMAVTEGMTVVTTGAVVVLTMVTATVTTTTVVTTGAGVEDVVIGG